MPKNLNFSEICCYIEETFKNISSQDVFWFVWDLELTKVLLELHSQSVLKVLLKN